MQVTVFENIGPTVFFEVNFGRQSDGCQLRSMAVNPFVPILRLSMSLCFGPPECHAPPFRRMDSNDLPCQIAHQLAERFVCQRVGNLLAARLTRLRCLIAA